MGLTLAPELLRLLLLDQLPAGLLEPSLALDLQTLTRQGSWGCNQPTDCHPDRSESLEQAAQQEAVAEPELVERLEQAESLAMTVEQQAAPWPGER